MTIRAAFICFMAAGFIFISGCKKQEQSKDPSPVIPCNDCDTYIGENFCWSHFENGENIMLNGGRIILKKSNGTFYKVLYDYKVKSDEYYVSFTALSQSGSYYFSKDSTKIYFNGIQGPDSIGNYFCGQWNGSVFLKPEISHHQHLTISHLWVDGDLHYILDGF